MWKEIAEKKEQFIGGELQDLDPHFGAAPVTTITDVTFDDKPDGMFEVKGQNYTCSVNREFAGLHVDDGWFHVSTPYNRFRFRGVEADMAQAA